MNNNPNILIYQNENGNIKVDVIFEDGELGEKVVIRNYRTTTEILNYSEKSNSCKTISRLK